jgi:ribosomal protein S18 acetylase RimI-like enzyme
MEIDIRSCAPADAGALALVGQATFLETYSTVLPAADILAHCAREHSEARYAKWLTRPGCRLWLAEVAATGAAVGYVALAPPDLPTAVEPLDLEIKRIYLLSRFQGAGVGARLLAAALEAARAVGARRVLLGVYRGNTSALAFYARQGFIPAGERKFQVGANAYDDLVLARGL